MKRGVAKEVLVQRYKIGMWVEMIWEAKVNIIRARNTNLVVKMCAR